MSLTCAECGTVNADGGTFCTGCGVSLAFATPTPTPTPTHTVAGVPRNPFPEEPARASGGGWIWVLMLALVGALAVAGTGWWALQRASAPDPSVPVTQVESATPVGEDIAMPAADAVPVGEETVAAEPPPPPPPAVAPPSIAPPVAKAMPAPKPRVQTRRTERDARDEDDDAPPRRALAKPVGPVGGGPASACYGRTGYVLDACIHAQCRQPHYRNHPACRGG